MPPLKRNVRVARERIKKMQAIRRQRQLNAAGSSQVPENYHEYAASVLASSKSPPPSEPAEPDTQSKELEMFKQIKSNLLKLRRLSESAPAPAPNLELEIFPEQEPKSEPKNETNESTSEFLDESKPPVEEEEHEEEQKHEKEEKEQEITEDPYLKEKTSRKRPIKEVKALPKKVKRNPRRQAVIRREEQEAIKAARNAPAIEKVYLNTAENVPKTTRGRKKQDKSSSETEPSLNRAERLYEFGKYVAEQLISFDDKDSETAQTEIKEVLQKYRLKYKIMKCLTKPGANVQAEAEATAKVTQINSNGHSATQSKKIDTNSVTGSKTYSRISKIVQPPDNRPVKLATASLIRQQLQKQITGPAANPMVSKPGQSTGNISIESNVPTQLKPNSAKTPKAYSKVAKNAQAKVNSPIEINIQAELASNSILQHTLQNQEPVKFVIIKTDQGLSLSTEQLIGAGKSINLQPLSIESSHPNAPLSTWPTLTIEPQLNLTQPVLPKVISTVAQPVTSLPINVASVEPNMNIPISQSDISNENENLPSLPHVMIMAPSETQPDEPDAESSGHLQVAMDEEAESITFKCEPDDSEEEN